MLEDIQKHRGFLIFEGIVFILLGMLGVALPVLYTFTIELLIGSLLVAGGLVQTYRAIAARHAPGFGWSLFNGLLSVAVGLMLIFNPVSGVVSLTILLMIFFFIEGIAKIFFGYQLKGISSWGWIIFSGLISLAMGAIILTGLPQISLWVIGLLVGINMIFFGFSLLFLSAGTEDHKPLK